jgi:hypothetical protein
VLRPTKPVPFGKEIKCPKCGNPFFAPGLVEDQPRKKTAGKKAKAGSKKSTGIKKGAGSKPSTKKPVPDDDDDEGGIYSFVGAKGEEEKPDIEYAPDMSIKDLRGPAQEAVVKPSNYMILIGGLCCLANIFLICLQFWPMVFSESAVDWQAVLSRHYADDKNALKRIESIKEYKELKDKDLEIVQEADEEERKVRFALMGVFLVLLIYNAIAVMGAVKMQNLESRRWGIVASIMTLLPMGAGGVAYLIYYVFTKTIGGWVLDELAPYYGAGLGGVFYLFALYVGIKSLQALMRQEVIDGYEYIAD